MAPTLSNELLLKAAAEFGTPLYVYDADRIIHQYNTPENDFWIWAIENKVNHEFIGICVFSNNSSKEIELGYRLNKKFWRLA